MTIRPLCCIALFALTACGNTQDEEAVGEVKETASVGTIAVSALQFIGILPSYECGESRRNFVARLTEGLNQKLGCTTVASVNEGDLADSFELQFGEGCHLGEKELRGVLRGTVAGGEDRTSVAVDLKDLLVGSEAIPASAAYETCGDEDRYSAFVEAKLSPERTARLDLTVANREGIFLIGQNTLVLQGSGQISHPAGVDEVRFEHLTYEIGQLMPWDGSLTVDTSDGRHVQAAFDSKDCPYRTGHLTVAVDDHKPVKIPVVR